MNKLKSYNVLHIFYIYMANTLTVPMRTMGLGTHVCIIPSSTRPVQHRLKRIYWIYRIHMVALCTCPLLLFSISRAKYRKWVCLSNATSGDKYSIWWFDGKSSVSACLPVFVTYSIYAKATQFIYMQHYISTAEALSLGASLFITTSKFSD